MKFKDYNYERYSYEAYAEAMQQAGTRLKEAKDYQSFKKAFDEGNGHLSIWIRCIISVMSAIRSIQTMPFIRRKTITGTRQCRR
ncbi:MAG: hypothetical protein ACLRL6_22530 [Clostridium sp.]